MMTDSRDADSNEAADDTETKYTTIAVTPEDVDRLDEVKAKHLRDTASYREVINFLVDEKEKREDSFEEVLTVMLDSVEEEDVARVLQRTRSDANWVRELDASGD